MAFLVYGADAAPTERGDRASYSFNQAGYPVVVLEDGTCRQCLPCTRGTTSRTAEGWRPFQQQSARA